jgi:uncharacterized protein (DUF1697 family)
MRYVVLLRGINVGGRNKLPMAALREHLSENCTEVRSYIQSGNLVLDSELSAGKVAVRIERSLPGAFDLDSELIRVLVLDRRAYREVIESAPAGFGADAEKYRYDVGFYVGVTAADVEPYISVNPEVDEVTCGTRAFYHRRVAALASGSRVSKIIGTPVYASLTIRNWRTVTTLAEMLEAPAA